MQRASELKRLRQVRYWSEREGRSAVELWRASGMTAGAFAAKHGLTRRRLTWWQERLGQTAEPRASVSASVAPVDIISAAVPSAASTMEVLLRGGRAVRVGADVDAAALARVVAALEALC